MPCLALIRSELLFAGCWIPRQLRAALLAGTSGRPSYWHPTRPTPLLSGRRPGKRQWPCPHAEPEPSSGPSGAPGALPPALIIERGVGAPGASFVHGRDRAPLGRP